MQSFFPTLLLTTGGPASGAATANAAVLHTLVEQIGAGKLIAFGIVSPLLSVLALWLASIIVVGKGGTFVRAIVVMLGWVAVSIGFVVVAAVVLPLILQTARQNSLAWLALPAVLLLGLVAVFVVLMKTYETGVLRALGVLVLYSVIGGMFSLALEVLLFGAPLAMDQRWVQQVSALVNATPAPDPRARREKLNALLPDLRRRFAELEIRRQHLPPGDARAAADYERAKADYERDLNRMRAEAATLPPGR